MQRLWMRLRDWRHAADDFQPCDTPWWEDKLVGCHRAAGAVPDGHGGVRWPARTVPVGPLNTYSNLAYPLAGGLLYAAERTPEALVMWAALLLLGIGSAAYHAVPGRLTNALDHAGMYATFLALTSYAAGATWPAMALSAVLGTVVYRFVVRANLNAMMGLFLWIAGLAAWDRGTIPPRELAYLVAAGGTFLLAMAHWQLDRRRLWTRRVGHAMWHVLTAAAIAFMYAAQGA